MCDLSSQGGGGGGAQPAAQTVPGVGLPHHQAVLATGTPSGASPGCGLLGRQQLGKACDSPQGRQWSVCPQAQCRARWGEGAVGNDPLSCPPALFLASAVEQEFDSNDMKRIPVTVASAELRPSPCCAVGGGGGGSSAPLCWSLCQRSGSQPGCACLCDFGISLPCMQLCTWLHPRGEGFSVQLLSTPVCVCAGQWEGKGAARPLPDPQLAFAGG